MRTENMRAGLGRSGGAVRVASGYVGQSLRLIGEWHETHPDFTETEELHTDEFIVKIAIFDFSLRKHEHTRACVL